MKRSTAALVEIAPTQACDWASTGRLTLVDVREADERRAVAPGAPSLHIPLAALAAHVDGLPADRPVAFVCAAGGRSRVATELAARAGREAWNVTGGMSAWRAAGLPTTEAAR